MMKIYVHGMYGMAFMYGTNDIEESAHELS